MLRLFISPREHRGKYMDRHLNREKSVRSSLLLTVSFGTLLAATSSQAAEVFDWSGFYAGIGLGGVVVNDAHSDTEFGVTTTYSDTGHGFSGSADFGYNWQQGQTVFGLDGRLGLLSATASGDNTNSFPKTTTTTFGGLISLEGRMGFAVDKLLIYGGAGLAAGQVTIEDSTGSSSFFGLPNSGWRLGAIGTAGAEYAVTDKISLKGDVSLVQFQNISTVGAGSGYSMSSAPSAVIGQVGVNFHF